MPTGEQVNERLQQRLCIYCGIRPALDVPYVCDECVKLLAKDLRTAPRPPYGGKKGR